MKISSSVRYFGVFCAKSHHRFQYVLMYMDTSPCSSVIISVFRKAFKANPKLKICKENVWFLSKCLHFEQLKKICQKNCES